LYKVLAITYNIFERALDAIDLKYFNQGNSPEHIGNLQLEIPQNRQYIRNILVYDTNQSSKIWLPIDMEWTRPLIQLAQNHLTNTINANRPFGYLTIRSGEVTTKTDDQWHTDGFSLKVNCQPQLSYFWSNHYPTEYVNMPFVLPDDFDPLVHNIFSYIQHIMPLDQKVCNVRENSVNLFDPYVIHRRQLGITGQFRTFVRYTASAIVIPDINLTPNPLLDNPQITDGISFRNKLKNYHS
jgi:hypothetical protein